MVYVGIYLGYSLKCTPLWDWGDSSVPNWFFTALRFFKSGKAFVCPEMIWCLVFLEFNLNRTGTVERMAKEYLCICMYTYRLNKLIQSTLFLLWHVTLNQCFHLCMKRADSNILATPIPVRFIFSFCGPSCQIPHDSSHGPRQDFKCRRPHTNNNSHSRFACFHLCVCVCFEVWRFLSSNKRHRTNCQKFIKCLALKRVRSLDFGSFHDFEAPDFGKLPIDPTRVGFAGSNSRISLLEEILHMVNWAGHYSSNWWFKRPPTCWHIYYIYIYIFFLRMPGRAEILIWLKWMFACTHCTFERALQRHLRCKSVLQCKFPLLVKLGRQKIKQWMWIKCDLHQGHSMSGVHFWAFSLA